MSKKTTFWGVTARLGCALALIAIVIALVWLIIWMTTEIGGLI